MAAERGGGRRGQAAARRGSLGALVGGDGEQRWGSGGTALQIASSQQLDKYSYSGFDARRVWGEG